MSQKKTAIVRCYAELNDFLSMERKQHEFSYSFYGNPAIKDALEALGIPHTEIDVILVNDQSVDFSYALQAGDRVAVYPVFELFDITTVTHLRPKALRDLKFILDVHLGKLAKLLRMLGFDTRYRNDFLDKEIILCALKEHRIILTRDVGLLKQRIVTHGYWLRTTHPQQQIHEVVAYFDLKKSVQPLSRCLVCNALTAPIDKTQIFQRLLPKTQQYFLLFYYCDSCDKVYWQGSHYANMLRTIKDIIDNDFPDVLPLRTKKRKE